MVKYKEYEIDIATTNCVNNGVMIPLPDGSNTFIPEENATTEELAIISQIKADVAKRASVTVKPTEEELRFKYEELSKQYIHDISNGGYSYDDEVKILREYLSDMTNTSYKQAFDTYNSYVISCKEKAHTEVYG